MLRYALCYTSLYNYLMVDNLFRAEKNRFKLIEEISKDHLQEDVFLTNNMQLGLEYWGNNL